MSNMDGQSREVIHSTAWREESRRHRLLLTLWPVTAVSKSWVSRNGGGLGVRALVLECLSSFKERLGFRAAKLLLAAQSDV